MTSVGIDAAPNEGAAGRRSFATVLIGRSRLLQEGLTRILENTDFQVVASAASVDQLGSIDVQEQEAILLIVDAAHDAEIAIRQLQLFKQPYPASRVAVLTQTDRTTDMALLFQAGANACFPETVTPAIFLKSLELVMLGETVPAPTALSSMLHYSDEVLPSDGEKNKGFSSKAENKSTPRLSEQQKVILRCLVEGDSNKLIAHKNNIAEGTVKVHVKAILRKIGMRNRTQAAMWAMSNEALIGSRRRGEPTQAAGVEARLDAIVPPSVPSRQAAMAGEAMRADLARRASVKERSGRKPAEGADHEPGSEAKIPPLREFGQAKDAAERGGGAARKPIAPFPTDEPNPENDK